MSDDETTGTVRTLEERFFKFITKDFPESCRKTGERLKGLEDAVEHVDTRLKNIEGSGQIVVSNRTKDGKKINWARLKEIIIFGLVLGAVLLSGLATYTVDPAEIENKAERAEAAVETAERQMETAIDLVERVDALTEGIIGSEGYDAKTSTEANGGR